jgi:hypothetical protein
MFDVIVLTILRAQTKTMMFHDIDCIDLTPCVYQYQKIKKLKLHSLIFSFALEDVYY